MTDVARVTGHYSRGQLLDAITAGVERLGKSTDTVTVEELAPVDEFHIGGRTATERLFESFEVPPGAHLLDVGCGLGGTGRFVAERFGCRVTGVDLTRDYIETGNELCSWVGLDRLITLEQGNALDLAYPDDAFDAAYMLHVGMNIPDKRRLMAGLHRVLKPGGTLAIYDVMRTGPGDLTFPVPWATTGEGSAVSTPGDYREALRATGFDITAERDRSAFAMEFFAGLQAATGGSEQPPPLGLHILMGDTAKTKIGNMIENVAQGIVGPVEIISVKAE